MLTLCSAINGARDTAPSITRQKRRTLIAYILSPTDPESWSNYMFFYREGLPSITKNTQVMIVLQSESPTAADLDDLPPLPSNADYLKHFAPCHTLGSAAWLITSGEINAADYSHFIFLSSAVRGPYMPGHMAGKLSWVTALTSMVTGDVKLAGSTISCSSGENGQPYVQASTLVTDKAGLAVIMAKDTFECSTKRQANKATAIAACNLILSAGYNIDSLMVRYEGVDWRQSKFWACNRKLQPIGESGNDGVHLSPYEVIFVPFDHSSMHLKEPVAVRALMIEQQLNATRLAAGYVPLNDQQLVLDLAARQVCMSQAMQSEECFDHARYRMPSDDFSHSEVAHGEKWRHYISHGQFSDVESRFTCADEPMMVPLQLRG